MSKKCYKVTAKSYAATYVFADNYADAERIYKGKYTMDIISIECLGDAMIDKR